MSNSELGLDSVDSRESTSKSRLCVDPFLKEFRKIIEEAEFTETVQIWTAATEFEPYVQKMLDRWVRPHITAEKLPTHRFLTASTFLIPLLYAYGTGIITEEDLAFIALTIPASLSDDARKKRVWNPSTKEWEEIDNIDDLTGYTEFYYPDGRHGVIKTGINNEDGDTRNPKLPKKNLETKSTENPRRAHDLGVG